MSYPHALAFTVLGLGKILVIWFAPGCFHSGEDTSRIWLEFMGCLDLTIGTAYLASRAWLLRRRLLAWLLLPSPRPLVVQIPQPTMQTMSSIVFPWHVSMPRHDSSLTMAANSSRAVASSPETLGSTG